MKIIIDTREQKPLTFPNHETISRKLDEGDYNVEELVDYVVFERKSLEDLYGTIFTTEGHQRFKRELLRAKEKGKVFYIFIEGNLEEFYNLSWSKRELKIKPSTMQKTIETMKKKYNLLFIECESRESMSNEIVKTIELNKKLNEVMKNE